MTQIITWEYILDIAKQCGQLRQEGKEEEAEQLEAALREDVKKSQGIKMDAVIMTMMGEKKRR